MGFGKSPRADSPDSSGRRHATNLHLQVRSAVEPRYPTKFWKLLRIRKDWPAGCSVGSARSVTKHQQPELSGKGRRLAFCSGVKPDYLGVSIGLGGVPGLTAGVLGAVIGWPGGMEAAGIIGPGPAESFAIGAEGVPTPITGTPVYEVAMPFWPQFGPTQGAGKSSQVSQTAQPEKPAAATRTVQSILSRNFIRVSFPETISGPKSLSASTTIIGRLFRP
jgi:hypothetical protein